jgi:hypothetical protein
MKEPLLDKLRRLARQFACYMTGHIVPRRWYSADGWRGACSRCGRCITGQSGGRRS